MEGPDSVNAKDDVANMITHAQSNAARETKTTQAPCLLLLHLVMAAR